MRQEGAEPGKQYQAVALDEPSLSVLKATIEVIRERARTLSLVLVRMNNGDIRAVRITSPGHVRYRLACRIGDRCKMPRYVEVETRDGPLWVRPHYAAADRSMFRISARVKYWDDRYSMLASVKTAPATDPIEIPFEPAFPPGYVDRLAQHGRSLYRAAGTVPAIAERVRMFFEDLGIRIEDAIHSRFSRLEASPKIEVVRAGRIEIVEGAAFAVSGGGAESAFEERSIDPSAEVINASPTAPGIRAFFTDMQTFYEEGVREGVQNVIDTLDGSRTTDEELAEQRPFVELAQNLSAQSTRAAGMYLQRCGVIDDIEDWRLARITEVVEALSDREGVRYTAQIRRRLGKAPAPPVSVLQRYVEEIAGCDLPSDTTSPEHTIILAARKAVELYPTIPIFVPPLDQWFDVSMSLIVIADRAVRDQRSRETSTKPENPD